MAEYRNKIYITDFEIWNKNYELQSKRKNIEMSQQPLDSISFGAKISDAKTPATYSSERKEKARKWYVR